MSVRTNAERTRNQIQNDTRNLRGTPWDDATSGQRPVTWRISSVVSRVLRVTYLLSLVTWCLWFNQPAWAAASFTVQSIDFSTHTLPRRTVVFRVQIRNNEATSQAAYMAIVLTRSNGAAPEYYSSAITVPAGGIGILTSTASNLQAGAYTVSAILFDALDERSGRGFATEPLHVGALVDSVSLFPTLLDFGTLDYGRQMLPVPVEVTWEHALFNRLGKDERWFMRIYTDNATRYEGIPGALRHGSPSGLVSSDGRYAISLKVWCINFGPDVHETGWNAEVMGPPSVDDRFWLGPTLDTGRRDEDRATWQTVPDYSEMTSNTKTWRKLIGQDPFDSQYVTEQNPTGDATLASPFELYLASETSAISVAGSYAGTLVVELYSP